jgi:4-aminobutyrate aminotransferase-like enzyme
MTSPLKKPTSAEVRAKHKEFLFPSVANYYKEPVVLESGHGARLHDLDGQSYLDFFGGILTVSVGHAHEKVNAARARADRPAGPRLDALPHAAHRRAGREARLARAWQDQEGVLLRERH